MKLIQNSGSDRVVDELRGLLGGADHLDIASPEFSLFAFAELQERLTRVSGSRVILPGSENADLKLMGGDEDRPFRNRLQGRALARACLEWLQAKAEVRKAPGPLPQAALIAGDGPIEDVRAITGDCAFSTSGLGLTPGNAMGLVQYGEDSPSRRNFRGS